MTKRTLIIFTLFLISLTCFAQYNWNIQDSGTEHDVICAHFNDANTGWIAGGGTPATILKTTDGGSNWSHIISDIEGAELKGIFFTDDETGWIVGENGTIIKTTNGGFDWEQQDTNATGVLQSVNFTDPDNGWIVGGEPSVVLSTQDGGNNWIEHAIVDTSLDLNSIHFANQNSGWIVGKSGTILHTTDAGVSWNAQVSGTSRTLKDVYFIDSQTGWIVGGSGEILHTTDGGTIWTAQFPQTNSTLKSVFFTNENNGWAVGTEGTIIYTTDGGQNWETEDSGTAVDLKGVFFADADNGWIVGELGLILYHDGNVDAADEELQITNYNLRNYPNPFNPETTIYFEITDLHNVSQIEIFNSKGQSVDTIDIESAIDNSVVWNAEIFASGVYFYKLNSTGSPMQKMVLMK